MPPKKTAAKAATGRTSISKTSAGSKAKAKPSPARRAPKKNGKSKEVIEIDSDNTPPAAAEEAEDSDEEEEEKEATIPPALLTRIMHEFYEEDGTRITRDANDAIAAYMDIFVKEAIARAAVERGGRGFLEVEDLERMAPQLLLDV